MSNNLLTILDKLEQVFILSKKLRTSIESYYFTNAHSILNNGFGREHAYDISRVCSSLLDNETFTADSIRLSLDYLSSIQISSPAEAKANNNEEKITSNRFTITLPEELATPTAEFISKAQTVNQLLKDSNLFSYQFQKNQIDLLTTYHARALLAYLNMDMSIFVEAGTPIMLSIQNSWAGNKDSNTVHSRHLREDTLTCLLRRHLEFRRFILGGMWVYDRANNKSVYVRNNENTIKDLTKFFQKAYGTEESFVAFVNAINKSKNEHSYQTPPTTIHSQQAISSRFWSVTQDKHHHNFASTLDKISRGEFKLHSTQALKQHKP